MFEFKVLPKQSKIENTNLEHYKAYSKVNEGEMNKKYLVEMYFWVKIYFLLSLTTAVHCTEFIDKFR